MSFDYLKIKYPPTIISFSACREIAKAFERRVQP